MPLPPSRSRAVGEHLAGLAGVVHLRQRRDRVGEPALLDEAAQPQAVELHRADLGEHLHQPVLHDLEADQRLAELHALPAVADRDRRTPAVACPSAAQATVLRVSASTRAGVVEAARAGQAVAPPARARRSARSRPATPRAASPCRRCGARRNPGVPRSTRNPLTCPSAMSRAHTTTTSAMVPLPIHFLCAVEDPGVAVAARRGLQRDRVRAVQRLGERERAELRRARAIAGSQRCFCSSEPSMRDRAHRQPGLHAEEGAEAAVAAVELHVDQPGRDRAHRRAAVALDAVADDAQLGQPLDQRPGELGALPVVVDDRQHLVVDEVAGAPPVVAAPRG